MTKLAWRKRRPAPPPTEVVAEQSPPVVDVAPRPKRRTKAQRLNDEIERQQLELQVREKQLVQVRARLRAEWEAGRPRERWAMDYGRYIY